MTAPPPLAQEIIRRKRDGAVLSAAQIDAFVAGLADGTWSDAQVGAMAMAVVLRGMDTAETVALTRAMTHSGQVLDWRGAGLHGPVLDKHSTGGVGDKVSLMLAPIVAACGGVVPMISGRGLGHTGGTLDKLEALPGYQTTPPPQVLLHALQDAGCAIVGASQTLAPADRRLYAVRDVTATVESVPLITASILSKKLAAGLDALVLDVKCGNGAFTPHRVQAQLLAHSLCSVAQAAGLKARALITDMSQPLGRSAGHALEVREAVAFLTRPAQAEPRLLEVTLALAAQLLHLGGLLPDVDAAHAQAAAALRSGAAAERFARMVAALGGPRDVLRAATLAAALPDAPVQVDVPAPRDGTVSAWDTRAVGLALIALGGGRRVAADRIDPAVGVSDLAALGTPLRAGQPLARVHARSAGDAQAACAALAQAVVIATAATAPAAAAAPPACAVLECLDPAASPRPDHGLSQAMR